MKNIKLYKYIFIITILFILLPSLVNAKTITTTYNNYYFFLKQYNTKNINNSTDYTAFPPISEFGTDKYIYAKEICLVRSEDDISECTPEQRSDKDNLIWTYDDFYKWLNEVETSKNAHIEEYEINNVTHSSKVLEIGNNKYYTHGSFSSNKKDWQVNASSALSSRYVFNNYSILSCASIRTTNRLSHEEINNNLIITIDRTVDNYIINDNLIDINEHISNCTSNDIYRIQNMDGSKNILSPVLYKYTYTETKEICDQNLTSPSIGKCNSGDNTLSSVCQNETVITSNSRANIKINQTGTVANVLTPESVYQGGGFKLGFVYYNEISWDFAGEVLTPLNSKTAAENEIISEMKNKLQGIEVFQKNIKLDNIMFGKEYIDSNLIQKECIRSDNEFNPGKKIVTVCTFYLPNSVVDSYTGKVTYGTSIGTNYGINNKYYTPLTYQGKYNIKATLDNLNVLNGDSEYWTGNWDLTFDGEKDKSCQIDVYGLLYNKQKPKYLYRPIDLKNPFPNRNAGINWYDWYKNSSYKEALENSYNDLEYSFNLNNKTISSIKSYNNQKDNDGTGYFNWEDIDNGKSSFIDKAITDGYGRREGDNS